jgi:hypothetical protein
MDRSASSCSGRCRSSSSGPGRRTIAAAAADVLHGLTPGRNNSSSASGVAMAVRNVRVEAVVHSRNVLLSSARRNNKWLRKPRENGRDGVAAVVAVVASRRNPPLRIKTPRSSSRGLRASRVRPVRRKARVRTRRSRAKRAEPHVPKATAPNDADAFVVAGGAVVGDRRVVRRPPRVGLSSARRDSGSKKVARGSSEASTSGQEERALNRAALAALD